MRRFIVPSPVVFYSKSIEATKSIAAAVSIVTADTLDYSGWLQVKDYNPFN